MDRAEGISVTASVRAAGWSNLIDPIALVGVYSVSAGTDSLQHLKVTGIDPVASCRAYILHHHVLFKRKRKAIQSCGP